MMSGPIIRLPKALEKQPQADTILSVLTGALQKLWTKSSISAAHLSVAEPFICSLQMEHKRGKLVRGYEMAERQLESELRGQKMVDIKTSSVRKPRISRLLILANDCSERYLRKVEGLLRIHQDRVLGIVIDIDSHHLGELFFGHGKAVKLLLVEHKESVASVLLSLAK
jgi:hypothetical protein